MSLKPIICCKEYTITAFSAVNNDELRDVVKCGTSSIFAETLDKTLACTYKVYGDNYVHVEFADNVISYVYDQYDGWSVRGVSREDSVGALKALYVKLGGDYDDVVGCVTDLEVLNKISVLYNGKDGARSYGEAVINITENYAGGGSGGTEPYVEYQLDENGQIITAKLIGFYSIPQKLLYSQPEVRSIDLSGSPNLETILDWAFGNSTKLVSIIGMPDSLTSIGSNAFNGCTSLALTSLPANLTSIGDSAFNNCTSLTNLEICAESIGLRCFSFCTGLRNVWFRNQVKTITAASQTSCPFYGAYSSLNIYAEPSSRPSGWGYYYNRTGTSGSHTCPVTYDQTTSPF